MHTSKQEIMYSHVKDWQASGLTQSKYCERVGINLATFSCWVVKYKNKTIEEISSNFIVISKTSKTRAQVIADYNNIENLWYEDKHLSSSDGARQKGYENS